MGRLRAGPKLFPQPFNGGQHGQEEKEQEGSEEEEKEESGRKQEKESAQAACKKSGQEEGEAENGQESRHEAGGDGGIGRHCVLDDDDAGGDEDRPESGGCVAVSDGVQALKRSRNRAALSPGLLRLGLSCRFPAVSVHSLCMI